MIGPHGEFGVYGDRWTPLHSTTEGWVESVALAHHASTWATTITKVTGQDVDALQLDAHDAVPEVAGLADNLVRPLLLRNRTKLNDLLVFLSILGGLQVFGLLGLVIGPTVVAAALGVFRVYMESRERLETEQA